MATEMSPARGVALLRLQGVIGGALMLLFIGLSFDLSVPWLLLMAGIGGAGGSVLVLKGADVHPPRPPLRLLEPAPRD